MAVEVSLRVPYSTNPYFLPQAPGTCPHGQLLAPTAWAQGVLRNLL